MSHKKKHHNHEDAQMDELLKRAEENDNSVEFLPEDVEDEDFGNDEGEDNETEEHDGQKERRKHHKSHFLNTLLNSEGEGGPTSVREVIRSFDINGEWFRRNLWFIVLTVLCLMAFVTNRYLAQQEMIEEARLKKELAEMRYKWLTRFSELTTSMRQSQIERRLIQNGDTTLSHSRQAPFIIWVDENVPQSN
ncbi:MAG: hypothetical protein KBT12_00320 [Bacteroidales bacterium]|nr:hypothetical protein [Candidatus Physcousia equi]